MTDPSPRKAAPLAEEARGPTGGAGLSISVEAVVWVALLAAATALRTASLERLPFTLGEAARALDAASVVGGAVPDTWTGDLVGALTAHLFRLFGEGETLARLPPAAAGAALVAALWFARPCIGRGGALVAAVLVGLSPLFVLLARSALAFSAGALLAAVMVLFLFAYLRDPRPWHVLAFAVPLSLAPLTDAVAVSAALAVLVFLALEGTLFGREHLARAWRAFRHSPAHWISVLLVLAAALELGFTHFGTSIDRGGLPGVEQWADMFPLPRDGRAPEYQMALLVAYDWPILFAGGLGFLFLAYRLVRGGPAALSPFQRFLLLWTTLAALTVGLATQREVGQLLILLLPLALLAGAFAEEAASSVDWSILRRWWPIVPACLALIAYAALLLTEWSAAGRLAASDRLWLVLALGGAAALLAAAYAFLARNATAFVLLLFAALALPFLTHSALAVALDDGAEFATDLRILGRADQFRSTVELLAAERGGPIVIDETLEETLAWPLRDLPTGRQDSPVVFGGDAQGASALIAPADRAPPGFVPLGDPWRLAQGWYPQELDVLKMWRWLVFRRPYGNLDAVDVRIYVPTL